MPRKPSGEFNQSQYINDFMKKNYDRINLTVPAGKKSGNSCAGCGQRAKHKCIYK